MNLVVDEGGLQGCGAGRGLGQETTEVPASHGGKHPDDPGEPGPGVEADQGEVANMANKRANWRRWIWPLILPAYFTK